MHGRSLGAAPTPNPQKWRIIWRALKYDEPHTPEEDEIIQSGRDAVGKVLWDKLREYAQGIGSGMTMSIPVDELPELQNAVLFLGATHLPGMEFVD